MPCSLVVVFLKFQLAIRDHLGESKKVQLADADRISSHGADLSKASPSWSDQPAGQGLWTKKSRGKESQIHNHIGLDGRFLMGKLPVHLKHY